MASILWACPRPRPPAGVPPSNSVEQLQRHRGEPAIEAGDDLILDLLARLQGCMSGELDGKAADRHIAAAIRRLDVAVPHDGIEPLHLACRHGSPPPC